LQYNQFPAPVIKTISDTATGLKSMVTGKTPETRQRGFARMAGGAGTMLGVPGTSQAAQWARNTIKSDPEEVTRMIKDSAKRLPDSAGEGRIKLEALRTYNQAKREGLLKAGTTEAEFRARYKAAFKRINP
jgi:hypothetical protein